MVICIGAPGSRTPAHASARALHDTPNALDAESWLRRARNLQAEDKEDVSACVYSSRFSGTHPHPIQFDDGVNIVLTAALGAGGVGCAD